MRRLIIALACTLALAGCAGIDRSILEGGASLTAPIHQPVSRNTLAQVESSYGIVLAAAVAYRRLPLCRRGETATLQRVCAQRSIIVTLQSANRKAQAALRTARRFVRNNPDTVTALDVVRLARQAVEEFQAVATANGVQ